jgi:RNA polymerase sigma-70 factor (ECF subfamily)
LVYYARKGLEGPWTMRTTLAKKTEPGRDAEPASVASIPSEDEALLRRVAAGDARIFRLVVERHLPHLVNIARRMLRDDAEAEDAAQEAFLRLWRNARGLEVGPGGLRPWLRRVVSNLCIDRIRANRHLAVVDEVPERAQAPTQMRELDQKELSARVDLALKALPERQRLALTLFHYEGLSQVEVGRTLGVSDEAVESLLARARRALKVALKNEWQELLPDAEDPE